MQNTPHHHIFELNLSVAPLDILFFDGRRNGDIQRQIWKNMLQLQLVICSEIWRKFFLIWGNSNQTRLCCLFLPVVISEWMWMGKVTVWKWRYVWWKYAPWALYFIQKQTSSEYLQMLLATWRNWCQGVISLNRTQPFLKTSFLKSQLYCFKSISQFCQGKLARSLVEVWYLLQDFLL